MIGRLLDHPWFDIITGIAWQFARVSAAIAAYRLAPADHQPYVAFLVLTVMMWSKGDK